MTADSSEIDDAIIQLLVSDPQLQTLCPDGVWYDVSGEGAKRFIVVSMIDTHDEPIFADSNTYDGRAYEQVTYLIKAVGLKSVQSNANVKAAAARIDALMEAAAQTLTLPGVTIDHYKLMHIERVRRVRMTEPDVVAKAERWFHCGGHYELWAHPI